VRSPDILVTNYSMLEYMLMRPIERSIFQQTRDWLASDSNNTFILVVDEAHTYRGVAGAEVAFLIRRLQARLGISRDQMRCIMTSASLGSGDDVESVATAFAEGLTGRVHNPSRSFQFITGVREQRPAGRLGTSAEAAALADFDLSAFMRRAEDIGGAIRAVDDIARAMGWTPPPHQHAAASQHHAQPDEASLRRYIYQQLYGYGPMEQLITQTVGNAQSFTRLADDLFSEVNESLAQKATDTLLALGTYAHNGERPLLQTRVHLLFRGLPSLYACINPQCDQR